MSNINADRGDHILCRSRSGLLNMAPCRGRSAAKSRNSVRVLPPQAMSSARLMCGCEHGTQVNVTNRTRFTSAEESLDYFEWRNLLYSGYIESMPVAGHDGKAILDYGCGPGHDVVGFAHFSNPARLIGMDVSTSSLAEARARVALHNHKVEFVRISENDTRLPLED